MAKIKDPVIYSIRRSDITGVVENDPDYVGKMTPDVIDDLMSRHSFRPWLGVLPGLAWVSKHEHDLDGWNPRMELATGATKHTLTFKAGYKGIVRGIMKGD